MKTMKAKYSGQCKRCGGSIAVDDPIQWSRQTGAVHADCKGASVDSGVVVTTFVGGGRMYRNKRGRCEDAPCCGCCD